MEAESPTLTRRRTYDTWDCTFRRGTPRLGWACTRSRYQQRASWLLQRPARREHGATFGDTSVPTHHRGRCGEPGASRLPFQICDNTAHRPRSKLPTPSPTSEPDEGTRPRSRRRPPATL